MDPLTAARAQMEVSLGFHMVFAALGICLPVLMILAEGMWLRTGKPHYLGLAKRWAKATGLLFAVGAVSGTALSFELGLLWPPFMELSTPAIGPAFALEGYAFFVEAIFIGLYLYGWGRLSPRAHWLAGFPIAISGFLSGVFVVATNAWMQYPVDFVLEEGRIVDVHPLAAFRSPMWLPMAFHLLVSCYVAAAWAVAGVYAWGLLRGKRDEHHRSGLHLSMIVALASTLLLPLSGDVSASAVAEYQPIKLAAMEGLFVTQAGAPFTVGGIPDPDERINRWGLAIPYLLSLLAERDPFAVVQGLDAFPRELWPNVVLVHISFQIMLWCGAVIMLVAAWYAWRWWRLRAPPVADRALLWGVLVTAPLGFVAVETGWIVTEAGRQPWTVYGVLRTDEAVTSAEGVVGTFIGFTLLYVALAVVLVLLLRGLARQPVDTGVA